MASTHRLQWLSRKTTVYHLFLVALLFAVCALPFIARSRAEISDQRSEVSNAFDSSLITHNSSLAWLSDRTWLHPSDPFALSSLLSARMMSPLGPTAGCTWTGGGGGGGWRWRVDHWS